jgi:hypothetical protein
MIDDEFFYELFKLPTTKNLNLIKMKNCNYLTIDCIEYISNNAMNIDFDQDLINS